jgi:hypothetical protein
MAAALLQAETTAIEISTKNKFFLARLYFDAKITQYPRVRIKKQRQGKNVLFVLVVLSLKGISGEQFFFYEDVRANALGVYDGFVVVDWKAWCCYNLVTFSLMDKGSNVADSVGGFDGCLRPWRTNVQENP